MELNESIYAYLTSVTAVKNLINLRLYPDKQKQKSSYTFPYVTYRMIYESEVDTIKEQTNMLIASTYEFETWSNTRAGAKAVAKQIRKAFKGFKGIMGGTGGVTVSAIEKVNAFSDTEEQADGTPVAYRESVEFTIWHYETN